MKKSALIISLLTIIGLSPITGQTGFGRLTIGYNIGRSRVINKPIVPEANFPSLFANYQSNINRALRVDFALKNLTIGLQYKTLQLSEFKYPGNKYYSSVSSKIISIAPIVSYYIRNRTEKHELGFSFMPEYSRITFNNLTHTISSSHTFSTHNQSDIYIPESKHTNGWGGTLQVGYTYYLSNTWGLGLNMSYSYLKFEYLYVQDKSLQTLDLMASIKVRLLKNKLYRYE